jgi:nucleotide-binding universal stress UspA family protein
MPILCAIDFSPCSQSALLMARSLARRLDESLFLLHVVEPPVASFPQMSAQTGALGMALTEAAAHQLTLAAKDCEQAGIKTQVCTLLDSPAAAIVDQARALAPRLIVMGTHGRKAMAQVLLGSVAATVVQEASCPVLVTRALPVDTRRWERAALQLVVALDGTPASERALAWLHGQGESLRHKCFLIRLFWPPHEAVRYGLPEPWLDLDPHPALAKLIDRDLRRTLAPLGGAGDAQVRFRTAHVNGAAVLAEEAGNANADAIVIGVPQRGLEPWHAVDVREVLRAAPGPVLCIPERAVSTTRLIPAIRSILVASDLSERARAAMPRAYALLRDGGGRVELLHVHVPWSSAGAQSSAPVGSPLPEARRHDLERQLRDSVPPDAEVRGIVTRLHLVDGGDPVDAILQAAERLGVDVVALASHGRSGLERALLGSVAEQVARRSPRPVFIVHQPEAD